MKKTICTICFMFFCLAIQAQKIHIKTGIEVRKEENFSILEGKRVGLITNPTGVDNKRRSTIDILFEAPNVNLVALFGPEHGVRGNQYAGDKVSNGKDPSTNLPVYSLYGKTNKPTKEMLKDIEAMKDKVQYVLVFKLSRFGRNAADVLSSLQLMQDYGVNLICVEDGIDSSKEAGKLMISVLSAVAEIERENILVQTMEGRRQKAREGRWNGGFAPYGYTLVNGELIIAEDEAEIIRIIFDKYIHTNMGVNGVADYLNTHGYKKKKRQNNTLDAFASSFIKGVLDNPIYMGKMPYGRRANEKIQGTRNEYHVVKQEEYQEIMENTKCHIKK